MALDFDGVSQYVDMGNPSSLQINEGSWMIWFKVNPTENWIRFLTKRNVSAPNDCWGYWSYLNGDGYYEIGVGNNTESWGYYKTGSVALDDGNVHHLAATFSNSDGLRAYVDGVEDAGTIGGGAKPSTIGTNGESCFIAKVIELGTSYYSEGTMWDARIYNRVLSPNEIAEIYHKRGADRVWEGLVGCWRLDEASGGSISENDVAPHNMTANNAPSPYVASASSEFENKYAYQAFDGSDSVWGASGTSGWLKLDYGSGNTPVLKCYAIQSYIDPKYQNVMPKDWTFKGSNDNSNWTTLDTRENITGWTANQWREFFFSNDTGYRYYMIDITENNGYSLCTYIQEMRHYTNLFLVLDLSGNGNHGTPVGSSIYQDSPHRLRRGVLIA